MICAKYQKHIGGPIKFIFYNDTCTDVTLMSAHLVLDPNYYTQTIQRIAIDHSLQLRTSLLKGQEQQDLLQISDISAIPAV